MRRAGEDLLSSHQEDIQLISFVYILVLIRMGAQIYLPRHTVAFT